MRYLKSATGNVWLLVVLVLSGPGLMPAIAQLGDREDGMRFIPDVPGQFRALTEFADPLGFNISTTPNPSSCRHYQGIARVDGSDGTPFFYVTRSGNTPDIPYLPDELVCDDSPGERRDGNLVVFRMGSREKNGERLRSNRLAKGVHVNNTAVRLPRLSKLLNDSKPFGAGTLKELGFDYSIPGFNAYFHECNTSGGKVQLNGCTTVVLRICNVVSIGIHHEFIDASWYPNHNVGSPPELAH